MILDECPTIPPRQCLSARRERRYVIRYLNAFGCVRYRAKDDGPNTHDLQAAQVFSEEEAFARAPRAANINGHTWSVDPVEVI